MLSIIKWFLYFLIDACDPNPCDVPNKSQCKDENNDGVEECSCDPGFIDDGSDYIEHQEQINQIYKPDWSLDNY